MNLGMVPVGTLLDGPELAAARWHGGREGAHRGVGDVRWVVDGREAQPGDLAVTPAGAAAPGYRLDALLRRLDDAGGCGLLLLGPGADLARSTVLLAERLAFPVLTLDHPEPVRLLQRLTLELHEPDSVRATTMDHLLRTLAGLDDGADILDAAARVLRARPTLLTASGTPILGPVPELERLAQLEATVAHIDQGYVWHPVVGRDRRSAEAWLAVPEDSTAPARRGALAAGLAVMAPFVLGWLSRERLRADRDAVQRRDLFSEILAQGAATSRSTVERALAVGWPLSTWHTAVHVLAHGTPAGSEREELPSLFVRELREGGWDSVDIQASGDGWSLWIDSAKEPTTGSVRTFLGGVRRLCNRLPRQWELSVGVGRSYEGAEGLARTVGEAKDAALLAASHDARPRVEHFDALGVARLLATWQQSEVTRSFAETVLAPLRETPGDTLLATLRAYLDHGAAPGEAAAALGVHRNTVGLRLQQIRDRLGVDLSDPTLRLALHIAVRSLPHDGAEAG